MQVATVPDSRMIPSEDGRPLVSILMVSYNTKDLTLSAIQSLFHSTRCNFELIVVDNHSEDGSGDSIRSAFPQIRTILLDRNIGFAAANNLGALNARGDYLLLLNPDTVVLGNAVDNLIAFAFRYPEAGIWGGRTLFGDGSLNPASCWRKPTIWSVFCAASGLTSLFPGNSWTNPEAYGGWRRDSEKAVDIVSGCYLLIHRSLWESLGGFSSKYFMYGEEADLCLRANKLGYTPMVTHQSTIIHYGGASDTVRAEKVIKLYKAKTTLMNEHWMPERALIGRALLLMNVLRRLATRSVQTLLKSSNAPRPTNPFVAVWKRRNEWLY